MLQFYLVEISSNYTVRTPHLPVRQNGVEGSTEAHLYTHHLGVLLTPGGSGRVAADSTPHSTLAELNSASNRTEEAFQPDTTFRGACLSCVCVCVCVDECLCMYVSAHAIVGIYTCVYLNITSYEEWEGGVSVTSYPGLPPRLYLAATEKSRVFSMAAR